jgi:hypothetical protein
MSGLKKLALAVCILALVFALTCNVKVEALNDGMETFFDSQSTIPLMKIQINATAQTQATENITVDVSLEALADITVENFTLEVFGFINGTNRISMANITDNNFSLNETSKQYNLSFSVPEWVWGVTYGEISLSYSASMAWLTPNITDGFPMTQVENTYLEGLEAQNTNLQQQVKSLNDSNTVLQDQVKSLNDSYQQLKGNLGNLDNTQRVATVLAVTTIIFLITTVYLVMRRPKESW